MTTPAAAGHLVECKQCHRTTIVAEGQNVHDALDCPCCPGTHVHADENGVTRNPCRNVIIHANAVMVPVTGGDA